MAKMSVEDAPGGESCPGDSLGDSYFPSDLAIYRALDRTEEERAWLRALPDLVAAASRRWEVRLGLPFPRGSAAWIAPGVLADGTEVVLKVGWPHPESRYEAAALSLWDGEGAVRLFAVDGFDLLLERCRPGTALAAAQLETEEALTVGSELLLRLHTRPPPSEPFDRLGDVTSKWASLVRERMDRFQPPFDHGVVDLGVELLRSLPASASGEVVLHGDFNPGNVLAAEREPWLAIDAKPMIGDPAYDPDPLISQIDEPRFASTAQSRYALVASILGVPFERLVSWGVARRVEGALWAFSRGDDSDSEAEMEDAGRLARLL